MSDYNVALEIRFADDGMLLSRDSAKLRIIANPAYGGGLGVGGTALRWRLSSSVSGPSMAWDIRCLFDVDDTMEMCQEGQQRGLCLIVMVVHVKTGRTALLYTNRDKKFVYSDGDHVLSTPETQMTIPPVGLSLNCEGTIELVMDEDDDDMLSFAVSLDVRSAKPVSPMI